MILTKEVEVKPTGKMIQYYKDKGYDAKCRKPLFVKVEDLPEHSDIVVDILCDYCHKNVTKTKYSDYIKGIKNVDKHACSECCYEKIKEVTLKVYGTKSIFDLSAVQDKCRDTCLERYGFKYPMQSEEIQEKSKITCKSNFGVEYPSQSPEVGEKTAKALFSKNSVQISKQQLYLHNLFGGELNFPLNKYNIDICFPNKNLAIEYNGGGHNLQVKLGNMTKEEFKKREIVRNNVLKNEGYKIITISSINDKLPTDKVLLCMLSDSQKYFDEYPNHSWIEFDVDNSIVRNAEHKNGILYNFGDLRKLKSTEERRVS